MMRGCPATGLVFHKFDTVTHRCACGRWEAGYKPAKAPTKPRAECQVCENEVAFERNGLAGHHGYKRPGCGWIVGDCFGVGRKPWPAYDALEEWLARCKNQLKIDQKLLAELPKQKVLTRMVDVRVPNEFRFVKEQRTFNKPEKEFKSTSGAWSEEDHKLYRAWEDWNRQMEHATQELQVEIKAIEREAARVEKRIEKAKSLTAKAW